jgi:hypothetical protein
MLQRVDAMEGELTTLIDTLRTGANRLNADLSLLEQGMAELYEASGRAHPATSAAGVAQRAPEAVADRPAAQPPQAEAPVMPAPAQQQPVVVADEPATAGGEPVITRASAPTAAPPRPAPRSGGDLEGARLVALNMALNGTPRAETDRYLAENFDLEDRGGLLDEVYSTVEG